MLKVIIDETNDCRDCYSSLVGTVHYTGQTIEINNLISSSGWVNIYKHADDEIVIENVHGLDYYSREEAVDRLEELLG